MPVNDIVTGIVVIHQARNLRPLLQKRGRWGDGAFSNEISLVTEDKEEERRALDLFSGTGSVTKVLQKEGFHVTRIDMNSKFDADLRMDILDWDYRK